MVQQVKWAIVTDRSVDLILVIVVFSSSVIVQAAEVHFSSG